MKESNLGGNLFFVEATDGVSGSASGSNLIGMTRSAEAAAATGNVTSVLWMSFLFASSPEEDELVTILLITEEIFFAACSLLCGGDDGDGDVTFDTAGTETGAVVG